MAKEFFVDSKSGKLIKQPDVNMAFQGNHYHKRTFGCIIIPKDAKIEGW